MTENEVLQEQQIIPGDDPELMKTINKGRMRLVSAMINRHAKGKKMLDVGCGSKILSKFIKQEIDYSGIDFFNYGLQIGNFKQVNLNEIDKLPFKDGSFDIITCVEVLEHIFYPEKIAREISRILRDDGIAIVTLPNEITLDARLRCLVGKYPPPINVLSHHWFFTVTEAEKFLKENFKLKAIDRKYYFVHSGGRFLPFKLRKWLANSFPTLFAGSVVYAFKK